MFNVKKHILAFSIALVVLIATVSTWVIFEKFMKPAAPEADRAELTLEILSTGGSGKSSIERQKGFSERLAAGKAALATGEYAKAIPELSVAAAITPAEIEPLLLLAEAQVRIEQFERARENLIAAEKLDAVHPDIFILRGIIYLREGKFPLAEQLFAKAAEQGKFWQGLLAAFYDREKEARKLLELSSDTRAETMLSAFTEYESFPDSPKTHLDVLLARAMNEIGEYQLAAAKIKPVLATDPDYRDAWLLLGYAQFAQQQFGLAKSSWQTAYSLDPAKAETQYFLALVNFESGDFPQAEHFFLLARENRFSGTELMRKLAETYFEQGKFREAAETLVEQLRDNEAATVEEFMRPIYLYLENVGDGLTAWDLAQDALIRFPESSLAYNFAGWVSLENDYLREAYDYLQKSIALNRELPWSHFNLGRYFERAGDISSALAAYRQTYTLDPAGKIGSLAATRHNELLKGN